MLLVALATGLLEVLSLATMDPDTDVQLQTIRSTIAQSATDEKVWRIVVLGINSLSAQLCYDQTLHFIIDVTYYRPHCGRRTSSAPHICCSAFVAALRMAMILLKGPPSCRFLASDTLKHSGL